MPRGAFAGLMGVQPQQHPAMTMGARAQPVAWKDYEQKHQADEQRLISHLQTLRQPASQGDEDAAMQFAAGMDQLRRLRQEREYFKEKHMRDVKEKLGIGEDIGQLERMDALRKPAPSGAGGFTPP